MKRDKVLTALLSRKRGLTMDLADEICLHPHAVSAWRRVPEYWLEAVAAATGLSYHQLRPDLYDAQGKRNPDIAVEYARQPEAIVALAKWRARNGRGQ